MAMTHNNPPPASRAAQCVALAPNVVALNQARAHLWQDRNPSACLKALPTWPQWQQQQGHKHLLHHPIWVDCMGQALMQSAQWAAAQQHYSYFKRWELAGLCAVAQNQLPQAITLWRQQLQHQPKAWPHSLQSLLQRNLQHWPSFLQLRCRLEYTLWVLYHSQQWPPLDLLLAYMDLLAQVNPEVYKLAGRTLLHCQQFSSAKVLLSKAQQAMVTDSENYFHLGQWYQASQQPSEAQRMFKQCLLMQPSYTPAKAALEQLQNKV